MVSPSRPTPLGCLIGFFALMLMAATALAGVVAWLAWLRPEKGIEWQTFAWLTAGFLAVTLLVFSLAWHRIKNGGSFEPFDHDSGNDP